MKKNSRPQLPDPGPKYPARSENELEAFEFELPESFVARKPALPRGSSRLMVLDRAALSIEHSVFESFPSYLDEGDCLVLNETKVRPCRISGVRAETGGKLELLFVRRGEGLGWQALVRPARRLKDGTVISLNGGASATVTGKISGAFFLIDVPEQFEDYLERWGEMPIPPYMRRKADAEDREHYQTVYARVSGSSAAPTAGLHFTREVLRRLEARGVEIARLILHVGPGTFRPLTPGTLSSQKLDPEYYELTAEACRIINRVRGRGGRVFAVGTSTARVLETVADGVEAGRERAFDPFAGEQSLARDGGRPLGGGREGAFDSFDSEPREPESARDRQAIRSESNGVSGSRDGRASVSEGTRPPVSPGALVPSRGWTDKFIYPPYKFKVVDSLVTNFHLPVSSVLLLVCAFAGREFILNAYDEAKREGYRFYSYGDGMLIV